MFVGTVVSVRPDDSIHGVQVRVRVDEAFKGVTKGQLMDLADGGNDCSLGLKAAERHVFYLEIGKPGQYYLQLCTRTIDSAEPSGEALLFLHGLPGSAAATVISGTVGLMDGATETGLPGVTVEASGRNQIVHRTLTNRSGAYQIVGLPPGDYTVQMKMPPGFAADYVSTYGIGKGGKDRATIQLPAKGSASVNFFLSEDTIVAGKVTNMNGTPLQGFCMQLIRLKSDPDSGSHSCTKEDGSFEIKNVRSGRYYLRAKIEVPVNRYSQQIVFYYPGDMKFATAITVQRGVPTTGLSFRVPFR